MTRKLSWNLAADYTDRLMSQDVPSYTRLDSNAIWQLRDNFTLGIYGENLLRDRHLEFVDPDGSTRSTLIRRSGYVKLTWRF